MKALGRRQHVVQHTVDSEAHHQVAFENLDVNIARAILDRLRQQSIDQLDDRRRVFGFEQVTRFLREFVRNDVESLLFEIDHQILGRRRCGLVVRAIYRLIHNLAGNDHWLNRPGEEHVQVVERLVVGRVRDRDDDRRAVTRKRQKPVFLRVVYRDFRDEFAVQRMLIDMGLEGQPVLLRERTRQPLRLERAHIDQHVG